jgi:hypothetical protein
MLTAECRVLDREERSTTRKPIGNVTTRSLEKKWHDIKDQFAAFAVAKA